MGWLELGKESGCWEERGGLVAGLENLLCAGSCSRSLAWSDVGCIRLDLTPWRRVDTQGRQGRFKDRLLQASAARARGGNGDADGTGSGRHMSIQKQKERMDYSGREHSDGSGGAVYSSMLDSDLAIASNKLTTV